MIMSFLVGIDYSTPTDMSYPRPVLTYGSVQWSAFESFSTLQQVFKFELRRKIGTLTVVRYTFATPTI